MEFIILAVVVGVVMAVILGGTFLTCRRVQNYCALEAKRDELVSRLRSSRLGRMLRSLNINLRHYVRNVSDGTIAGQMKTCQKCDATASCDAYLADHDHDAARARDFCPNMHGFDRFRGNTP